MSLGFKGDDLVSLQGLSKDHFATTFKLSKERQSSETDNKCLKILHVGTEI